MSFGRPTEYKPEYAQMLIDYFSAPPYKTVMKPVVVSGQVIEVPTEVANDIPTLAGFAVMIGHHRETLRNWCDNNPDFFAAYKMAKEYQEHYLATNGNKGLIKEAFAIFTAKNVIGWRDKQPDEEKEKPQEFPKYSAEEIVDILKRSR